MKFTFLVLITGVILVTPNISVQILQAEKEKSSFDEVFKKLDAEVRASLKKDRNEGLKELERVGNQLAKDYPNEPMPYAMLNAVARMTSDQEKSMKILKRLASLDDSNPQIARVVSQAKGELKKREAIGKTLDLSFISIDGRKVDLSQFRGKVVLLDFWATWCGPCKKEIPKIKAVFDKHKEAGLVVIGVSLDTNLNSLKSFIAREEMSWPQYFDGLGWKTHFASEFNINSIPEMWLIDKRGKLVDQNARVNFEDKIITLLKSKNTFPSQTGITEAYPDLIPVGSGTGFLFSSEGLIATNHHVIQEYRKLIVRIYDVLKDDYVEKEAEVIASDIDNDLSIIKVNGSNFDYLNLLDSSEVKLGEEVFTIGFPIPMLLGNEPKYNRGSISSLSGIKDNISQFQISIPLQPGNSGGPLINNSGNVIGVTTSSLNQRFVTRFTDGTPSQLVNYAVKSSHILNLMKSNALTFTKSKNSNGEFIQQAERVSLVENCKKSVVQILVFN